MTDLVQLLEMVSDDHLARFLCNMVDIPSPTGEEAQLAMYLTEELGRLGYESGVQILSDTQANAMATRAGTGGGKTLLLYAPLDTVTSSNHSEDIPWAGPKLRPDMIAHATRSNGNVVGLGAQNPKGHGACILEVARILSESGIQLSGDLQIGFGAGGMPTHGRAGHAVDSGHGAGCKALLAKLPDADGAIIAKSGLSVTWEEVGFLWLEVCVFGTHTYVGSRHLLPYKNAITGASRLIIELESWFDERARTLSTQHVSPQAVISQIESGWRRMPAFTPDCCRFLIDLRFGPDMSAEDAEKQFRDKFDTICSQHQLQADFTRIQTIDASRTDQSDPIIQTVIQNWEELKGRPHEPFREMSGATDANIIRQHGIPTARVGLPKADIDGLDFQLGMNCASLADMRDLTRLLLASTHEFCGGN